MEWWKEYFDEVYFLMYTSMDNEERTNQETDFIADALNLTEKDWVLDAGCGWGRHSIALAKRGISVVGLDYSEYLLEKAKQRADQAGIEVEFIHGDIRALPFPDASFTAIFSYFTSFGYFSDEENKQALKEFSRVLKPKGKLLIETINLPYILKNFMHKNWFKAGESTYVIEEMRFDAETSRVYNKRYIFKDGAFLTEREHFVRLYLYPEMAQILSEIGLTIVETYGDRKKSSYSASSPRMIIVAQKS